MIRKNARRIRDTSAAALLLVLFSGCASNTREPARPQGTLTARAEASNAIDLVESVPIETVLDHPSVPDADSVWPLMIDGAKQTLDVAQFYASEADTDALRRTSKLAPVIAAIERAIQRGVRVRFLADASFVSKYPETLDRLAKAGAAVRHIDVSKTSGGILHAKYFVVDGEDAFVGSQNFDWRALSHIFEMGVHVKGKGFAGPLLDVFETDWAYAGGGPAEARVHAHPIAPVVASTGDALAFVASPKGWLPEESSWDLPKMVAMIDGATKAIDVEVLVYKTKSRDGSAFTTLDDALRRAASRGVTVRMLVSDWGTKPGSDGRRDLDSLARLPNVEIRVLMIPPWSGGDIPFARVAHAKFMTVDRASAWVGTSNWEGDYFTRSRNVGVIASGGTLGATLDDVFAFNWRSPYAKTLEQHDAIKSRAGAAPP